MIFEISIPLANSLTYGISYLDESDSANFLISLRLVTAVRSSWTSVTTFNLEWRDPESEARLMLLSY